MLRSVGSPTLRRPPCTDSSQPRLTLKQERCAENMGSWATLYVQTPMVQEGGALCLPIAHSLPSTIPVLQSPNSATCHWCRTYVLRASSAPRHNSRGTDVASALIFLTPLCPLTPLSDSVLQGLMTEVCTQSVFLTQKNPKPCLWCVSILPVSCSQPWPWPCTLAVLLAEPGQEASTRLHKFKPTPPAPLLKREGLWRSVINSSFTEHVKREGGAAL